MDFHAMAEDALLIRREGPVAILTLNRPEKLNALNAELRRRLVQELGNLDRDESARVVILTGSGRAFTVGLDLKELAASGRDVSANVDSTNVVESIRKFSKPLIAAINGLAITGGLEITLACDIVLASKEAVFADTHVKVGLTPGWGLSQRLPRLIGVHRAKELSFSARHFGAREAEAWGLVNHICPTADLIPKALELAHSIAKWPPGGVGAMKRMIDEGLTKPLDEALRWEAATASENNSRVHLEAKRLPLGKT